MAIIRWRPRDEWDPFGEMLSLRDEMNRLFQGVLSGAPVEPARGAWAPALDTWEDSNNVYVKADLPGMKKEEIEVSVLGDELTIKGEKKRESDVKERNYRRSERCYGAFERRLSLPATADTAKVEASYKDGVLELTLPKKEEAKPKQVNIEVK